MRTYGAVVARRSITVADVPAPAGTAAHACVTAHEAAHKLAITLVAAGCLRHARAHEKRLGHICTCGEKVLVD